MNELIRWIFSNWIYFALITSAIYGMLGVRIHVPKEHTGFNKFLVSFYQFNFNFIGSFAGWSCLHVLKNRLIAPYSNLGGVDFVLFILAVLGLTGNLAESFYGIVISIKKIGEAFAGMLLKKV
jgi:hypothetical protein